MNNENEIVFKFELRGLRADYEESFKGDLKGQRSELGKHNLLVLNSRELIADPQVLYF